jgi:extracellular factor (EF) 3-hydroxypalmitic acid methyl ester biosynthesis protein
MVNMILRDPHEGASLFAKLVNVCFLKNPPAEAHRNRIEFLREILKTETLRASAKGRPARIFNLGVGPAMEVQQFLKREEASNRASFTLLDFNDETIAHTEALLKGVVKEYNRSTEIQFVKKSVHQILKDAARPSAAGPESTYDLIYCAGLFDYISDRICKRLMNHFYEMLAPGGLLVATNVDASKPFRHSMEFLLEWHLICRNVRQVQSLAPDSARDEWVKVHADVTGVNVFIEVRKPGHAP